MRYGTWSALALVFGLGTSACKSDKGAPANSEGSKGGAASLSDPKSLSEKGAATVLDQYVAINSRMRETNRARLRELAKQTEKGFLWNKPFIQMKAQVRSSFADRRSYVFDGKVVDRQDHLGFDLASVRR
ncbi:MAG: hypothetical protein KC492_38575, partial [Myxococcales bacterium]|nr:hypothetical protein [Myxococcales bacterium]